MTTILQAAKYLVHLSYGKDRVPLTPLKLQKILYLAQGWSFVWDGRPLFPEEFEAWQYGPVNRTVYSYFRKYGRDEIPEDEGCGSLPESDAESTLDAVWHYYSVYSAIRLADMTRMQAPWEKAARCRNIIRTEDIRSYFQSAY